jgi:outer membrane protein
MTQMGLFRRARLGIVAMLLSGGFFIAGCIHIPDSRSLEKHVAPAANMPWKPPVDISGESTPDESAVDIPENLLKPGIKWKLMDIIEVALRNNPETRQTWYEARSAAADWLSRRGDKYPEVYASAATTRLENLTSITRTSPSNTGFTSSIELTWLLFDFGGRDASIEEKRRTLLAADFSHNAAVQDQVFLVIETYFEYANARALEKSLATSMEEASTNLDAAEERHRNGLATIADVLQAKTALSQAKLNYETERGLVKTIRGALATAMGIPANTRCEIEELPMNPPVDLVSKTVEDYIKKAEANRPDLAAQRNRVEASMAHVKVSRSELCPSLSFRNTIGSTYNDLDSRFKADNSAALQVNIPLWDGHSRRYNLLKAEQDAETQKAKLQALRQDIILQVWSSYYMLQTSIQRVRTSNDLLESATSSYEVALGRYKEGVGGLLDLLSAQSTLMNARAQQVSAQADWYIAFSRLARDTGQLWTDNPEDNRGLLDTFPTATIEEHHQ